MIDAGARHYARSSGRFDRWRATYPESDLLEHHLANPIPGVYLVDKQTYLRLRADPDALERFLADPQGST